MSAATVKKVKPYPIPVQITGKSGPLRAQILRLELYGFMADMDGKPLKVGESFQVSFEIPVSHVPIAQTAVVMRTFDRPNLASQKTDRIVEFHFAGIDEDQRKAIFAFLTAIRQDLG